MQAGELKERKVQGYGWVPDLPDARDHPYQLPRIGFVAELPRSVNFRSQFSPPYDQEDLGSCTGNAIAGCYQFLRRKQGIEPDWIPSRLFIYYNERKIEHTVRTDSGAMIRDGIKSIAKRGVCPEDYWPYDTAKFTKKPNKQAFTEALNNQALKYRRLTNELTMLQSCLAEGFPFVFGFTVYESFESQEVARTGIVPMPSPNEGVLGGHAVVAVGYDQDAQRFIVRNSWGSNWGDGGYFTMPFAYLTDNNLSDDIWTIRLVESPT